MLLPRRLVKHFNQRPWKLLLGLELYECIIFDSPILELLLKQVLVALGPEFGPQSALIPQIVEQFLECVPIPIDEDLAVDFLNSVQTTKHLVQGGSGHGAEDLAAGDKTMGSADVELDDVRLCEIVETLDILLVLLIGLFFCQILIQLILQGAGKLLILLSHLLVIVQNFLIQCLKQKQNTGKLFLHF